MISYRELMDKAENNLPTNHKLSKTVSQVLILIVNLK